MHLLTIPSSENSWITLLILAAVVIAVDGVAKRRSSLSDLTHPRRPITWILLILSWSIIGWWMLTTSASGPAQHSLPLVVMTCGIGLLLGHTIATVRAAEDGWSKGVGIAAVKTMGKTPIILSVAILIATLVGILALQLALLVSIALPIVATRRATTLTGAALAQREAVRAALCKILGCTANELDPGDFDGDLTRGVTVSNVPASAVLHLDQLPSRLNAFAPGLHVAQADPTCIALLPASVEQLRQRQVEAQTGGLLTADTTAPSTPVVDADAGSDW